MSVLGLCFQDIIKTVVLILTFQEPLLLIRVVGCVIRFDLDRDIVVGWKVVHEEVHQIVTV
jgi:hypothetical protein